MASRRFLAYDPYDYYYTAPYHNPYQYYRHQPADPRGVWELFPAAADAEPAARAAVRPRAGASGRVSVPVRFVGSDPEVPKREPAEPIGRISAGVSHKPAPEEAAVRLQAAARGFMARRAVRAVRAVEREAEEVAARVAREAEALRADARARIGVEEALMRLLLRLDAVRGAREYRRRVTRRVLALQEAVDALQPKPVSAPAVVAEEPEVPEAAAEMAPGLADAAEHSGEMEEDKAPAKMEVDGSTAAGEPDAGREMEPAPDVVNLAGDKAEDSDQDGSWEMVTEEPAPAPSPESPADAQPLEATPGEDISRTAGGVDARKMMEMVAALCERSAQQCAVIGALAERVDALERAVRRVEDAERRRRRAKKLGKEGKGRNHSKCHSD